MKKDKTARLTPGEKAFISSLRTAGITIEQAAWVIAESYKGTPEEKVKMAGLVFETNFKFLASPGEVRGIV